MRLPQFPVEGGCQCGAVRYRIKAPPLGARSVRRKHDPSAYARNVVAYLTA